MPLCTSCAYPADHLYTTYTSASNIRLGVCAKCGNFLDPLVEHPPLLLVLDLILLKPRVYLHLLFNRGTGPKDGVELRQATRQSQRSVADHLVWDWTRLALIVVIAETATRLLATSTGQTVTASVVVHTCLRVLVETSAQHFVTTILALGAIRCRQWINARISTGEAEAPKEVLDGRRTNFRPIMISLTLLYATVLPVALQLVLGIWHEATAKKDADLPHHLSTLFSSLVSRHSPRLAATVDELLACWAGAEQIWAGTRLLGGMSAGFG